jgi:hypothetical protein
MKTFTLFTHSVLVVLLLTVSARAELTTQYGVNINDTNNFSDNINLYQLFGNYFADQLAATGEFYTSSNDLYNARGVDPYTDWTTNNSQIVGAFKVADLGHTMSMVDSTGHTVASLMHVGGTVNIGEEGGITDLSGQAVSNIADGLNVSFRLDADWYGTTVYSWSSDTTANDGRLGYAGDSMVHMLAIDITDLYNAKNGTFNDSVFMFCWEDLHATAAGGGLASDFDYQDFVAIVTNVTANSEVSTAATPEPATMMLVGLGLAGLGLARRRAAKK